MSIFKGVPIKTKAYKQGHVVPGEEAQAHHESPDWHEGPFDDESGYPSTIYPREIPAEVLQEIEKE
jgi:hypothetical protein